MENAIIQRVKEIVSNKNISERAFALKCGINYVTMNNYFLGKRDISLNAVYSILETFEDISSEWLIRGKGNMFLKNDSSIVESDSDKDEEIRNLKEEIIRLGKEVSYLEGKISVLIDDRVPREKDDQEGESA